MFDFEGDMLAVREFDYGFLGEELSTEPLDSDAVLIGSEPWWATSDTLYYQKSYYGGYVVRLDMRSRVEERVARACFHPTTSRDGKRLCFEVRRDQIDDVVVVDMDTRTVVARITDDVINWGEHRCIDYDAYTYPCISPCGNKVLYSAEFVNNDTWESCWAVFMYDINANVTRMMSDDDMKVVDTLGIWSPDGDRIAYKSRDWIAGGRPRRIVVKGLGGDVLAEYPFPEGTCRDLCWHPGGKWISYTRYEAFSGESAGPPGTIEAVNIETGKRVVVTEPSKDYCQACWRPGSDEFVCVADYRQGDRLVLLRCDLGKFE